ncbi:MAG: DUF1320 domain-containing protein [Oceanospirillaceae bacterium]|nr:DUF1320 domain-containing protein [Oceanospirillaceae bacterium]
MYINVADMSLAMGERDLIELTHDAGKTCNLTEPDTDKVHAAIADAQDTVNAYLSKRYVIPIAAPCSLLKRICTSIARHWIFARRAGGGDIPDDVVRLYKEAMTMLRDIQAEKANLTGALLATGDRAGANGARLSHKTTHRSNRAYFDNALMGRFLGDG